MLEHLETLADVELLADDGRTVDLDAVESQGLFLLAEELGLLGVLWEIPQSKAGEEDGLPIVSHQL